MLSSQAKDKLNTKPKCTYAHMNTSIIFPSSGKITFQLGKTPVQSIIVDIVWGCSNYYNLEINTWERLSD